MLVNHLFAGAGLLVSLASAGCFSGGAKWDDTGRAINELGVACDDLGDRDYPDRGNDRTSCRPGVTQGQHYIFRVERTDSGSARLSKDDCRVYLGREIGGCQHGGQSTYANPGFQFTSDPNDGEC